VPRVNHAEISASCIHLYSISLIVRLVWPYWRKTVMRKLPLPKSRGNGVT
jgi:hypothetical protein